MYVRRGIRVAVPIPQSQFIIIISTSRYFLSFGQQLQLPPPPPPPAPPHLPPPLPDFLGSFWLQF